MGRTEARESLRSRWVAREGGRSLLYESRAVADWAKLAEVMGCLVEGEGGAGDAGPGDGAADGGFFCKVFWLEPPHCDMKDRTVTGRTGRNISECSSNGEHCRQRSEGSRFVAGALFTSLWTTHGSNE
jgi:hypothetical protein